MKVIGLTGGIATGKSTVAAMFAKRDIPVFDADAAAHHLMAKGGKAVSAIEALHSDAVIDGAVDRKKLGAYVFADPQKLRELENILHPLVRQAELDFISQSRSQGYSQAVLEIPLLFETGADALCDVTVVTDCPPDIQEMRATSRPNMTKEKLSHIIAQQMPAEEKRARADYIINTDAPLEQLEQDVQRIVESLKKMHIPDEGA